MFPLEVACFDPYSLIHDLNNRFSCPCHDQTVVYKVPGGSFKVKVEVHKSSEIMKRIVSISQTTFYQVGDQLVGYSGPLKIELEGKSATSEMSFVQEESKLDVTVFSDAIKGFQELYNIRWNANPFPYPEGHGNNTHPPERHEESPHPKEIADEPSEYFPHKNQSVISVKN